jgi:hypothetical protein
MTVDTPARSGIQRGQAVSPSVLYTWGDPSVIGREASDDHPAVLPCPVQLHAPSGTSARGTAAEAISTISLGATHAALTTRTSLSGPTLRGIN